MVQLAVRTTKTWRECWFCIREIIELSTWDFGPGNFIPGQENWLGIGCLSHILIPMEDKTTLGEAESLGFNLPYLSEDTKEELLEAHQLLKSDGPMDRRVWPHDPSEMFTIKSYKKLSNLGNHPNLFTKLWKPHIPTKVSIFLWKMLHNALPVDLNIQACHMLMASKCTCCANPNLESINHLFYYSDLATHVWNHFMALTNHLPISSVLWEIWKARCSRKYDDDHKLPMLHAQGKRIILKVRYWCLRLSKFFEVKSLSNTGTDTIATLLGIHVNSPPQKPPTLVYWTRPPDGTLVMNTDAAAKEGLTTGGGILRDHQGVHIANFFCFYGDGTNNSAECKAILDGRNLCNILRHKDIWIHSYSTLAISWCTKQAKPPWNLMVWIKRIWDLLETLNVGFLHIYRQGNKDADHLASLGLKHLTDGTANINSDKVLKPILSGDTLNLPNIRFRI
ncbi:Ribonuclease h domain [Thalictrum thalictroides]|uniref:Ribonuclease h domain n=1 Tax=Thalictrum thalictroides TaxID=46969 RepID=A0A7J6W7G4_THATH|nr:Ribonuclease h domain [Thalictrum thalictroides]